MQFAKIAVALICAFGCVAICSGQGAKSGIKPDLSGTWEFDRNRSNVGKSSNSANPPEQIKIAHVDPELKMRRKVPTNGQPE